MVGRKIIQRSISKINKNQVETSKEMTLEGNINENISKPVKTQQRRGMGKKPQLSSTCIICRQRIVAQLKVSPANKVESLKLQAVWLESFFMLFGASEEGHSLLSLFLNEHDARAELCNQCSQSVYDTQYIFWQLRNLENRLINCQNQLFAKLRANYDAIAVSTLFSSLSEKDIQLKSRYLSYDEIVKILFETFKGKKEVWPTPSYSAKWERIQEVADKLSTHANESGSNVAITAAKRPKTSEILNNTHRRPENVEFNIENQRCHPHGSVDEDEMPIEFSDHQNADNPENLHCSNDYSEVKLKKIEQRSRRSVIEPEKAIKISVQKKKGPCKSTDKVLLQKESSSSYHCKEEPEQCTNQFASKNKLAAHIKMCHKEKMRDCEYEGCARQFTTQFGLEIHQKKAHQKTDQKRTEVCDKCGVKVPRGDLKKHYFLRHVGVGKFSCDVCLMDFNDINECEKHELLHNTATLPFICVVCETVFTNTLDLKGHVSSNHMSSGLKCGKCGIMKPNEYLLQRHLKIHERKLTFLCECGKSFGTKGHLNYHKQHHHINAGKTFPCELCGKTFLYMKNAVRHLVTHREEKPFKCKICPKTFNYSHLLKKHEEIHSGTKNYSCELCGKRFRQEQNLTQHKRSHRPKLVKQNPTTATATGKKSSKPKKRKKIPELATTSPTGEKEESYPVIVGSLKTEANNELTTVTFSALPEECNNEPQYATVVNPLAEVHEIQEIQLSDPNLDQSTTATVVFLTTDANFQWIAELQK